MSDLGKIKDPVVLNPVLEFLQFLIKNPDRGPVNNRQAVLSFAGTLNAIEAPNDEEIGRSGNLSGQRNASIDQR